ncbi:MAG: hypothetical protein ACI3ZL_04040 [Candidatus Cryptobacteroides sp.]
MKKRLILSCLSALLAGILAPARESSDSLAIAQTGHHSAGRHVGLGSMMDGDTTRFSRRSLRSRLLIPKYEWQVGLSVAYMNLSADDGEIFLLVEDTDTGASIVRFSVHGSYSYMDNQTLGLRFQYTNGNCTVDSATLDLLGNLSLDLSDVRASTMSYAGFIYNRSYVGLDNRGRVGLFIDAALGYTHARSNILIGEPTDTYTLKNKVSAVMSPGIIFFPMNNISVFVSLSLAELSYNNSKCFSGGAVIGHRDFFRAQAKINILALNFGLTVHL